MRTPALQPTPPSSLKRDPVLRSPADIARLFGASPPPERSGSLRELIVRWLNQEL